MDRKEALRLREIEKWERERAKPKNPGYFAYLVFVICLIYITDEVASQIGTLMKSEIAADLLSKFGDSSVGMLDLVNMVTMPFMVICMFYRPLADRLGRRLFLVINTIGMSLALLLIYLSDSLVMYAIGACMVQFFIPHDMHVVYIMETAPAKHRARVYSSIKFVANLGVILIPLLRRLLMQDSSQWRNVYLIPAIIGLVSSFVALLTTRETDAFIESRLRYLRMNDEERALAKQEKRADGEQGGLVEALKFAFTHKQLKWLYITSALINMGFLLTMDYQAIMTYSYAQHSIDLGEYATLEAAAEAAGLGVVTTAIFFFAIGSAVAQVVMGFVSDCKGRKAAAVTMTAICTLSFLVFFLGARFGLSPIIVGLFCGACIGSYYATNDVLIIMIGESSPTSLRSSTISAQYVVTAAGIVYAYGLGLPLITTMGNGMIGIIVLCMSIPGFVLALLALCTKTKDTTGVNMDTVTGCEWD